MNRRGIRVDADRQAKILAEIAEFQRTHRAFEDFQRFAQFIFRQRRMTEALYAMFCRQADDYRAEL
jgi:hypothetical protein